MDNKLEGRIAVITGGAKGIGFAIAKRFLEDRIHGLVLLDWNEEQALAAAAELDPWQERVIALRCNVASRADCAEAIKATIDRFGTIDILVNNAGINRDRIFHKMTDEEWFSVLDVDLHGVYNLCRETVPIMREKEYGRIVNVSSMSAYGKAGQANYSAAKGAVISLTKTLAGEEGPKKITVNAVAPGKINTDMYKSIPKEMIEADINANVQLRRLGEPSEVASVVSFLASDDASYITGQVLLVNGGAPIG